MMKRLTISLSIAGLALVGLFTTVYAAGPARPGTLDRDQLRARDTLTATLRLSQAEIMDLRHQGLTLAQVAERQQVDPQLLIDALTAQWAVRIDSRVANGALTTDEAAALKARLALQAKAMVNQATMGGAGNGGGADQAGAGHGPGDGTGVCRGSGS